MPLKDYILELFEEANLTEFITENYRKSISLLSSNLVTIVSIVLIICFMLYIILQNYDYEDDESNNKDNDNNVQKQLNSKLNFLRTHKIQLAALNLNYGIYRDCTYKQLCFIYNDKLAKEYIDNTINKEKVSENSFKLTNDDIDSLKDLLQR